MAQKRKDWNGLISGFKASDLVFLDESGCNTDMTRRYAYSLGGSRAVDSAPLSKPKNTTILSSIQLDGTLRYTTFSGGTTVERFKRYLEIDLLPHLNDNSVLIMDNMKSHHAKAVKNLLDSCDNDDILNKFSAYISKNPVFSLPEGSYDEPKTLSLYSKEDEDQIYYTTDGTDPTSSSNLYTDSIALKEGQTIIKAVTVNKKGITSDIVSKTYTIAYEAPDPPQISPSSGSFTTDMDTNIYIIVPKGCRAYYAFDKKPTIADELYQEDQPVKMLKGTHTFYAILVDEHNKVSSPGSAIYKLTEAK